MVDLPDFSLILEVKLGSYQLLGAPKTTTNARLTARAWLTESVDRALRRNLRQQNLDLVINYLIQRAMIPRYVVTEVDQDPWVLHHPDLHAANFIIDDDYNVLG